MSPWRLLRKWGSTHLIADRLPVNAVQERLGHSRPDIVLIHYAKLLDEPGVAAAANNQLGGSYQYDSAGNMTFDATAGLHYTFDQENRVTGANGYTYMYDSDGNRVVKSNGAKGTLIGI